MNNIRQALSVAALACAFAASSPAFAQDGTYTFTGPRIGGHVGFADDDAIGTEAFTFGVNAGYDFAIGERVIAGATVEYQDSTEDGFSRDLSATARVGGRVGDRVLIYGLAGYTNLRVVGINLDGVRVGAGVEVAANRNVYVNAEYRYSNYELGADGFQTLVGIGFRF